ncbi:MAG TPA: MoxR family ATPase [Acidimicrobiales bacterium]
MSDPRVALLAVRTEVAKVVVGHDAPVTALLTALVVGGHVLFEGVPGTAKTLLVKAVAAALQLDQSRIQFTPDLMPADVTGHEVLTAGGRFEMRRGPVFTNLLLADEINRTPPRTQSALLEAMEERRVTVFGNDLTLPDPFCVVATQNPIEQEGTYPLPEAQLDRFLFKVTIGYPDVQHESEVLRRHRDGLDPHDLRAAGIEPVAGPDDIVAAQEAVAAVAVEDPVIDYVAALARATRELPSVSLGVSPRGGAMLLRAARVAAWLGGSDFTTPDHVKSVSRWVLRHRVSIGPEAALDGTTADGIVDNVLSSVPVPR